jgi:hypothetical protein
MSVEIEVIDEIEESEDGETAEADKHSHDRKVRVDNKDNGDTVVLRVPLSKTIDEIIAKMYDEFRLTRRPDDRLTCRGDGVDVFQYAHLTLQHYLREGHCRNLRWAFVGDTGGALR